MKYQYLTNTPLEEALKNYLKALAEGGTGYKTEEIPVFEACGRITSEAIYAKICAPHYNACAMDGIAVYAGKTFGAAETTPVRLREDEFLRVDTGDPLPSGADCVIMIEDAVENDDGSIDIYKAAVPWQHVRQIGEDICAGDMILPSFAKITPAAVGAMLAGGVMKLRAVKAPIVGIIPTGDEIIPPCENPGEGDIIEFNSSIFSSILRGWGALPKVYPIVKDKKDLIISALRKAAGECDAVILNAGSSAGREDFSVLAVKTAGEVLCHGIAIKPGKPAILGRVGTVPVIGVPGYPVSGIIVLEKIFKPVMEMLCREKYEESEELTAEMSRRLVSSLKYREFVRTRIACGSAGKLSAVPLSRGAGVVTSFVKADGIIDVPQNCEGYETGEKVCVKLLRSRREIANTLSVIGSHDPIIDEIADILRRNYDNCFVASSHVGSMGGIAAVKRGEAQLGGIHLLDEDSGEYNISYVRKYFKKGEVLLVRGIGRIQGIMVRSGNPMGILSFKDLAKEGLSYVNRQKGSGTRILFDYLAKRNNIDASKIYGCDREEFTHTGVAAQIASGTADAGMGIYSAARTYGLDFIPICEEEYDFLVDAEAYKSENVQNFFSVLKSEELAKRLSALGGYKLGNAGEIKEVF